MAVQSASRDVLCPSKRHHQLFRPDAHIASAAQVDGAVQRRSSGAEGVRWSMYRDVKQRSAPARAAGWRTCGSEVVVGKGARGCRLGQCGVCACPGGRAAAWIVGAAAVARRLSMTAVVVDSTEKKMVFHGYVYH